MSSSKDQFKLPPSPSPTTTRTSTCLCKSVSLSVTGEDKSTVLCHCNNCKQRTGSAFMYNHRFLNATIEFRRGGELVMEYGDSSTITGATLYSHFCEKCVSLLDRMWSVRGSEKLMVRAQGSPLYLTTSAVEGFVALTVGNLEGERKQPYSELFVEDRYSWIEEVASGVA